VPYVSLCSACVARYMKMHQNITRYITTMKFVIPKIAVQERKVNFNYLKEGIAFEFRFRKVAFCVNQNLSETKLHPHTQRTLKRKDL